MENSGTTVKREASGLAKAKTVIAKITNIKIAIANTTTATVVAKTIS